MRSAATETSAYERRPWLDVYRPDIPGDLDVPSDTALDSFLAMAREHPERTFLDDSGTPIGYGETATKANAFAAALLDGGIGRGDRVAVYLQNRPEFAVAQLGIWSAGAVQVPLNPMMRAQELHHLLTDSGTRALVTQDDLWELAGREAAGSAGVGSAFVVGDVAPAEGVRRWTEVLTAFDGASVPDPHLQPDDLAHLVYTSGTTGRPKGAMNTHGNVSFNAEVFRRWMSLDAHDVILGGAPLFHVTGLVAQLAAAYRSGCSISLFGRFDAERCLEVIERTRATFTVMSITAYIALLDAPSIRTRDLSSLTKVCSGGAPVPLATVERWRQVTGRPICNIYGLTETTSPSHLPASLTELAPVDQASGTLSVGVPVPSTHVRVVDPESMRDVGVGEEGELWIKGPQVVPGYWERPDATRESIVDGYLRTGDVGRMDERGFFYVVDRIKDMINASGFKVWPREVEDYLYQHPAVREAAVVGVPDPYRGETVKAFVSLKTGSGVTAEEIIEFCRGRMAAYKYPRLVEIVDEVPKTTSGKVLRRELRDRATPQPDPVDPASPGRAFRGGATLELPDNSWKLAPELEDLREKVYGLVRDEVLPVEATIDYDAYALPPEVTKRVQDQARAMDIWCVASPRKYGGSEMPLLAQCIVSEEAAKCRMGAYIPAGGAFGWDPPNVIFQGSEDQIQRYAVPTIEKGERTFVAITEPGGGADPARALATTARRDGNEWVLNGQKIYITSAQESRWGIAFARTGEAAGRHGITCFIIETGRPGIKIEEVPVIRPYYPTRITFDDYRIPLDNVLGDLGKGFEFVQKWLIHGRVPYAAGTVGIAQAALEIAIDYARNRNTFGGRLADKQGIQWMLVDSEIEIRAARLLIYQAAWKAQLGEEFRNESSIAKVYATEMANRVVDRCVQILGARGVTRELPLERWYRELRIKRIGEGPSEVHRLVVGRNLVGAPPKKELVVTG